MCACRSAESARFGMHKNCTIHGRALALDVSSNFSAAGVSRVIRICGSSLAHNTQRIEPGRRALDSPVNGGQHWSEIFAKFETLKFSKIFGYLGRFCENFDDFSTFLWRIQIHAHVAGNFLRDKLATWEDSLMPEARSSSAPGFAKNSVIFSSKSSSLDPKFDDFSHFSVAFSKPRVHRGNLSAH